MWEQLWAKMTFEQAVVNFQLFVCRVGKVQLSAYFLITTPFRIGHYCISGLQD